MLISTFAVYHEFAAVFEDRGGVQKLLSVQELLRLFCPSLMLIHYRFNSGVCVYTLFLLLFDLTVWRFLPLVLSYPYVLIFSDIF